MSAHTELPAQPYVLKLKPQPGESLLGYIHRLAIRNGHERPHWIKSDIGLTPTTYSLSERQLQNLSVVSGRSVKELAAMQSPPATKGRHTTFMGWPILDGAIERGRSRFCQNCISEEPFHRQIWNLRIGTVCPLHGTVLIDKCPVCGELLHWKRLDIFRCSNGHDLKRIPKCKGSPPSELMGVRAIHEKCDCLLAVEPVLQQLPEVVRSLELTDFAIFLLFVGRMALRDNTNFRSGGAVRYDAEKTHRILQAGFDIASSWPTGFTSLMGELHTEGRRRRHQVGLGSQVALLVRMFAGSEALRELIKDPIREHVSVQQIFLYGRTRRHLQLEADTSGFVTLFEAAKILDRSEETTRKLAIAQKWIPAAPGLGHVYRIPREKVEVWAKKESTISLKKAGKLLGLWRTATTAILERGQLRCVHGCNGSDRSCGYHIVREADVQRLLDAIQKSVRRHPQPDRGPLVPWRSYQKRCGGEGMDAGTALQAMLEGRLVACGKDDDRRGFDGLLFQLLDLTDICADERTRDTNTGAAKGTGRRYVSTNDAALIADMHRHSIFRAIELKLIKAELSTGPRSPRTIELTKLREFARNYTNIGQLARKYDLHLNTIKSVLARLRIQPAGKKTKGRYQRFPLYSHADLQRANFSEAVAALSKRKAPVRKRLGRSDTGRGGEFRIGS